VQNQQAGLLMFHFSDTFHNFLSGLGVVGRDKMTAHSYISPIWNRQQLEAAFKSDWIARKAISIPAQDATRQWRSWQAKQDQIEKIEETEKRLGLQLKLQMALTKARLYGGACLMIGVDGNLASELIPEEVPLDGFKFIHVLAPHQLTVEELEKDLLSPYYGQPKFYNIDNTTRIHPSRMVRLTGLDTPDPMTNQGWGDPMMNVISDSVNSAGAVMSSIATMIQEAKLDVIKIPGMTEIMATEQGTNRLIKRFSEANVAKSVINAIVIDGEETWERIGTNFAGMPEVLQMYLQIAAGAADIPVTRFLGQSPAGLNSTGEGDLQNYYDKVKSDQELRLSPALEKLDQSLIKSALGKLDPNIFYEWNSLWQMDAVQQADIAKKKAEASKIDVDAGLVPVEALAKGRCNQLIEDGTYPGLEAAIETALLNQELGQPSERGEISNAESGQQEGDEETDGEDGEEKTNGQGNGKAAEANGAGASR
jgi:phage-related protein (TIGR01555 family)